MSRQDDLAERAELSLIAADAAFFLDLTLGSHSKSLRSITSLALMPFLSAFLHESIRYIKQENPETVRELRSRQELLRASQMSMKLLDDTHKSLEDVLDEADELVAIVRGWFFRDHRGILGPLKRLL